MTLAVSWQAAATTPKAMAKVEFDKAQIQYKLGHFDEALAGYSRAYELFPAPAFLFNIGQCHKNLKNYERAIFFFEGYLRDEKSPARRALAEELLTESKAELEKQQRVSAAAIPGGLPAAGRSWPRRALARARARAIAVDLGRGRAGHSAADQRR